MLNYKKFLIFVLVFFFNQMSNHKVLSSKNACDAYNSIISEIKICFSNSNDCDYCHSQE